MNPTVTQPQRDHGIDLLRILSMMMVVLFHIITAGGLRNAADGYSLSHAIVWLLNAATACAVNVYGLISGYVGCTSRHRLANLLYLWCQVAFYSISIGLLFVFDGKLAFRHLTPAYTPVISSAYWYFTAYTALFFFIPALNHLINTLAKKDLLLLGISCILLFSVIPTVKGSDLFCTKLGYSFLWLAVLYLLGGICRKLALFQNIPVWLALCSYLLCCFANLIGRDLFLRYQLFSRMYLLFEYTAPGTLLTAFSLLALFAGRTLPGFAVKVLRRLSPLAFGVYLIHVHPILYPQLFQGQMGTLLQLSPLKMLSAILLILLGIYLGCTAIDALRAKLFDLLRIRPLCNWADQKITEFLDHCIQ